MINDLPTLTVEEALSWVKRARLNAETKTGKSFNDFQQQNLASMDEGTKRLYDHIMSTDPVKHMLTTDL